jgi:hypothetical protein
VIYGAVENAKRTVVKEMSVIGPMIQTIATRQSKERRNEAANKHLA